MTMGSKIKLKKFCLMLSYCGKQYSGMQRNPGAATVEECLLKALRDSEMIPEENYIRPQLMYFQRAARTDKHVSAIRQIISLKLTQSIMDRVDDVNKQLPPDIRLMGVKRVTGAFDAKNFCDARTYSYLMPSFVLSPVSNVTQESYRVTPEILKLFNETLRGYVGTHVFHNFTSGKKFKDDSASRVIRFMYCSEPFYPCDQDKLEFVVVRVKGQSFMMHQIRKMIGLAIAVVKGYATEEHIKISMEAQYMDVPKAPGLGLMLEEVHFDRYNKKFGGDGHHEPIEWEDQNAAIEKFKNEMIYPVVVETELKEKSMLSWLDTLPLHSYGKIPVQPSAITKLDQETISNSHERSDEPDEISQDVAKDEQPTTKRFKPEHDSSEKATTITSREDKNAEVTT